MIMKELSCMISQRPRDIWSNEATEFTPWLAEEEHLKMLGTTIGMELELWSTEEKTESGRADIVCLESATDRKVIIENQLEKTDSDHLGRILSYASALEAKNIIWIATEFDDQYRSTIDWLNSITDDDVNFFGIEIMCFTIDNSKPAPYFKVVASPNNWKKHIKDIQKTEEDLTETKILQQEYWQAFIQYIKEHPSKYFHPQKASAQHWMNIAIGKSGYKLSINVNSLTKELTVQFVIDNDLDKVIFDKIEQEHKNKSFTNISPDIVWRRTEGKKVSIVQLSQSYDFKDKHTQQEQFKWFSETIEKFVKFFQPIVKSL